MRFGSKRRKYSNTPVIVDGVKFDSKWEYECYNLLLMLASAPDTGVTDVEVHRKWKIEHNGILIATINIDFTFRIHGKLYVADAKSPFTVNKHKFILQKKMLKAFHDLETLVFVKGKSDPGTVMLEAIDRREAEIKEKGDG